MIYMAPKSSKESGCKKVQ